MRRFFDRGTLGEYLESRQRGIREEVNSIGDEQILGMAPEDLNAHLASKFSLEPLALEAESSRWVSRIEEASTTRDDRFMEARIRLHGARAIVLIPMTGSPDLANYSPSTSVLPDPQAESVKDGVLTLVVDAYNLADDDGANARALHGQVDLALAPWLRQLDYMRPEVERWVADLPGFVSSVVEQRLAEARKLRGLRGAFDIPLVEKGTASFVPLQAKVIIPRPIPTRGPIRDEPRISETVYAGILERMRLMGRAMEESPSSYEQLGEERLRDFFLPILNSQFGLEGSASGETFRRQGKTDILVKFEGGVAFAAECKIWEGAAAIGPAIDQLLGYLTW